MWILELEKKSKLKQSENREFFKKRIHWIALHFLSVPKNVHVIIEKSKANFSLFLNTIDAIRYAYTYFPNAYTWESISAINTKIVIVRYLHTQSNAMYLPKSIYHALLSREFWFVRKRQQHFYLIARALDVGQSYLGSILFWCCVNIDTLVSYSMI